jgi:hypothetical protein
MGPLDAFRRLPTWERRPYTLNLAFSHAPLGTTSSDGRGGGSRTGGKFEAAPSGVVRRRDRVGIHERRWYHSTLGGAVRFHATAPCHGQAGIGFGDTTERPRLAHRAGHSTVGPRGRPHRLPQGLPARNDLDHPGVGVVGTRASNQPAHLFNLGPTSVGDHFGRTGPKLSIKEEPA